jgi:hypothetical protein
MSSIRNTTSVPGIKEGRAAALGEKLAGWGIALMIIWLFWNQ